MENIMNMQNKVDTVIRNSFPAHIVNKCYWENGKLVVPYVQGVCDFNKIMDALYESGQIHVVPDVIEEVSTHD